MVSILCGNGYDDVDACDYLWNGVIFPVGE